MSQETKQSVINEIESILRLPSTTTSKGGTPTGESIDAICEAVLGAGASSNYPNKYRRFQALIEALGGVYDPGIYPKTDPNYRVGDTSEAVDIYGRSAAGDGEVGGGNVTREGLNKVRDLLLVGGYGAVSSKEADQGQDPQVPDFDIGDLLEDDNRLVRLARVASRPRAAEFRSMVREAYGGRCCVTGYDEPISLEAAHVYPYMGTQSDRLGNALLLRTDIHRLFDARHLAIDETSLTVIVSGRLRSTRYGELAGTQVQLPTEVEKELRAALEAHRRRSGL